MLMLASCGGSTPSSSIVDIGKLDDYFTVVSYKLETDAKEKGIEHLDDVHGTLVLVIQRNKQEMKFKPSNIEDASITGSTPGTSYYVFRGDATATAKSLLKMAPGKKETVSFVIKGIDPYNKYNSEEENTSNRKQHYEALTKKGLLDKIELDISWDEDVENAIEALKALKGMIDDD